MDGQMNEREDKGRTNYFLFFFPTALSPLRSHSIPPCPWRLSFPPWTPKTLSVQLFLCLRSTAPNKTSPTRGTWIGCRVVRVKKCWHGSMRRAVFKNYTLCFLLSSVLLDSRSSSSWSMRRISSAKRLRSLSLFFILAKVAAS